MIVWGGEDCLERNEPLDDSVCEDIANLKTVDAPTIVKLLRLRYSQKKPYVMCRRVCISVNPLVWLPIYGKRQHVKYMEGCSDAHVYLISQRACMEISRRSQTIIITGESGAGKTEVARLCLDFIAFRNTRESVDQNHQIEAIINTGPVLEFLGNAQTVRNGNSSRFGKFLRLYHNKTRQVGASIQTYLLEKNRVTRPPASDEGTFRIFYAVYEDDRLRNAHALHAIDPLSFGATRAAVPSSWSIFERAARLVGFDDAKIDLVVSVVVGVSFLNMRDYANAALVLGVDHGDLTRTLTSRRISVTDDEIWTDCSNEEGRARTRALAMALYQKMFDRVVMWMNESVQESELVDSSSLTYLNILDIFGFENFERNGFEQLCINYCNERLQQLFVNDIIVIQQIEYATEGIVCDHIEFDTNDRIVELCDKVIFTAMNEALQANQSAEGFLESINLQRPTGFAIPLVRQSKCYTVFTVDHYAATVMYDAEHFCERNSDELRPELVELVQHSNRPQIAQMFAKCAVTRGKLFTPSVVTTFKGQMQSLVCTVAESDTHYIRCIKPNSNGTPDLFDDDIVLQQVQSTGLSHACRVMRTGFEFRMKRLDFLSEFKRCVQSRARCAEIGLVCDSHSIRDGSVIGVRDGFWGKTMVYMSDAYHEKLVTREASYVILRALQRRVRMSRAAVSFQRVCRGFIGRRRALSGARRRLHETALRDSAAKVLQRFVRDKRNQTTRHYKMMGELGQLRRQVQALKEALRTRDAWLFRATIMLKQHTTKNAKISDFLSTVPPR